MIEDSNLGGNGMKTNDEALLKIKYNVFAHGFQAGFRGQTRGRRQYPVQTDPGPEGTVPLLYIRREIIRQRGRLAEGKCPSDKQSDNIIQVISSACGVRSQDSL